MTIVPRDSASCVTGRVTQIIVIIMLFYHSKNLVGTKTPSHVMVLRLLLLQIPEIVHSIIQRLMLSTIISLMTNNNHIKLNLWLEIASILLLHAFVLGWTIDHLVQQSKLFVLFK